MAGISFSRLMMACKHHRDLCPKKNFDYVHETKRIHTTNLIIPIYSFLANVANFVKGGIDEK